MAIIKKKKKSYMTTVGCLLLSNGFAVFSPPLIICCVNNYSKSCRILYGLEFLDFTELLVWISADFSSTAVFQENVFEELNLHSCASKQLSLWFHFNSYLPIFLFASFWYESLKFFPYPSSYSSATTFYRNCFVYT